MKRALQIILAVSLFGLVFSGVLTYQELFGEAVAACPAPPQLTIRRHAASLLPNSSAATAGRVSA